MMTMVIHHEDKFVECIPLSLYARVTGRSVASVRHLVYEGNTIRKMKALRMMKHLFIPMTELYGFPQVDAGVSNGMVYHWTQVDEDITTGYPILERTWCKECTFGQPCEVRAAAEEAPTQDLSRPIGLDTGAE